MSRWFRPGPNDTAYTLYPSPAELRRDLPPRHFEKVWASVLSESPGRWARFWAWVSRRRDG